MLQEQPREPVRLVVWDLDETFWKGTLTEGGITFLPQNRDLVIELARRGIMSSICSKNDLAAVRAVCEAHGIWDYFIFPSINWEPKGPRLARLIETVKLRPETVLFVDDNPGNRREALFFVPGLQVEDETFVPVLGTHPLLKGKDDKELTRLKQYKVLERRQVDETAAGGDNLAFLRSSGIRITIETDVEKHLDRAIELINRTNQLNFTKRRLPENREEAAAELLKMLSRFNVNAGLVKVHDHYGDYGFCGFYAMVVQVNKSILRHFCFSCRTLDMGVEAFVYQTLNRPELKIVGEVLSDPVTASPVDWIDIAQGTRQEGIETGIETGKSHTPFSLRGGCDLAVIEHYARLVSADVSGSYNIMRNGIDLRLDHSLTTRYAIAGVPKAAATAICRLGYQPEDFACSLFSSPRHGCWVFSFIPDQWVTIYEHKETGTLIPFTVTTQRGLLNVCDLTAAQRAEITDSPDKLQAMDILVEEFRYIGRTPEAVFKDNIRYIFGSIPTATRIFVILGKEYHGSYDTPQTRSRPAIELNQWIRDIAREYPNVEPLLITDFVENPEEIDGAVHFRRMVYFRLFEHIRNSIERLGAQSAESALSKRDGMLIPAAAER
ncbi:MAG TPA: HAD-IIIC family phosphatase [Stellaceae bacterium]|nr:HAD-IIIC family phosphatase [Stellaceae bacterium]